MPRSLPVSCVFRSQELLPLLEGGRLSQGGLTTHCRDEEPGEGETDLSASAVGSDARVPPLGGNVT